MTKHVSIQYNGFLLRITYIEEPYIEATRMDPAEGGDIDLQEIFIHGDNTNIVDLLEPQWDAIKNQLYNFGL